MIPKVSLCHVRSFSDKPLYLSWVTKCPYYKEPEQWQIMKLKIKNIGIKLKIASLKVTWALKQVLALRNKSDNKISHLPMLFLHCDLFFNINLLIFFLHIFLLLNFIFVLSLVFSFSFLSPFWEGGIRDSLNIMATNSINWGRRESICEIGVKIVSAYLGWLIIWQVSFSQRCEQFTFVVRFCIICCLLKDHERGHDQGCSLWCEWVLQYLNEKI